MPRKKHNTKPKAKAPPTTSTQPPTYGWRAKFLHFKDLPTELREQVWERPHGMAIWIQRRQILFIMLNSFMSAENHTMWQNVSIQATDS
ncbi:hypothetical protein HYALB_00006969 [Hymenoscyphus albidus]|uniref:Uncharacterized protein n=1 Tax=Hymenoscyphus albidus TaxID=595503 RepID=A0A9N9LH83_9HELO|nr:hypothetical protein HYALB_00006969 [Hymenoscyphus albidus]